MHARGSSQWDITKRQFPQTWLSPPLQPFPKLSLPRSAIQRPTRTRPTAVGLAPSFSTLSTAFFFFFVPPSPPPPRTPPTRSVPGSALHPTRRPIPLPFMDRQRSLRFLNFPSLARTRAPAGSTRRGSGQSKAEPRPLPLNFGPERYPKADAGREFLSPAGFRSAPRLLLPVKNNRVLLLSFFLMPNDQLRTPIVHHHPHPREFLFFQFLCSFQIEAINSLTALLPFKRDFKAREDGRVRMKRKVEVIRVRVSAEHFTTDVPFSLIPRMVCSGTVFTSYWWIQRPCPPSGCCLLKGREGTPRAPHLFVP